MFGKSLKFFYWQFYVKLAVLLIIKNIMEEIKKINTPEDILRVKNSRGLAITNIGAHGNNGDEMSRIDYICDEFEAGRMDAKTADEELNVVWRSRQQGAM
jgi:hypothetical protein